MARDTSSSGNVPQWDLADRLRKIRRDRHLTQEQMADRLGVKAVTLSAWEAGRTRPQDVIELAGIIQREFGVPAAWTLGVMPAPDTSATNPHGIPVQRKAGKPYGRRATDHPFMFAAAR